MFPVKLSFLSCNLIPFLEHHSRNRQRVKVWELNFQRLLMSITKRSKHRGLQVADILVACFCYASSRIPSSNVMPPLRLQIRIFVATWNVGGNTPHMGLNLNDFLPADDHSDIYVLGYGLLHIFFRTEYWICIMGCSRSWMNLMFLFLVIFQVSGDSPSECRKCTCYRG